MVHYHNFTMSKAAKTNKIRAATAPYVAPPKPTEIVEEIVEELPPTVAETIRSTYDLKDLPKHNYWISIVVGCPYGPVGTEFITHPYIKNSKSKYANGETKLELEPIRFKKQLLSNKLWTDQVTNWKVPKPVSDAIYNKSPDVRKETSLINALVKDNAARTIFIFWHENHFHILMGMDASIFTLQSYRKTCNLKYHTRKVRHQDDPVANLMYMVYNKERMFLGTNKFESRMMFRAMYTDACNKRKSLEEVNIEEPEAEEINHESFVTPDDDDTEVEFNFAAIGVEAPAGMQASTSENIPDDGDIPPEDDDEPPSDSESEFAIEQVNQIGSDAMSLATNKKFRNKMAAQIEHKENTTNALI